MIIEKPKLELRYYQREAINAIYDYFKRSDGNPLISMATGCGKALTQVQFCKEAIEQWPDTGIINVTSVKELVKQNYEEMLNIWWNAPASIYSAGLKKKDLTGQIIFAGIQSIYKKAFQIPRKIDLVLCDECQDISEVDGTMFRKFISDLKTINPALKVIGYSATVYRMSQGMLTEGKNALFDEVVYEYGLLDGINDGFLSPLISKEMATHYDLKGVGTRNGDYIQGQLEKAVDKDPLNAAIVDELLQYGADRKCWLMFCAGVDHAIHMRDEIRSRGIICETVSANTPSEERDRIFRDYKSGIIRCVTNVGVMVKGSNIPAIDLIAACRPSKSAGFVVQAAGRGTRLFKGKSNCLFLDYAGLLHEHGPIDLIKAKKPSEGGGEAIVKECPQCKSIISAGFRECPDCGHVFPEPEKSELNIAPKAFDSPALSTQIRTEWKKVTHMMFYRHKKEGKPDSLRVEYLCGPMDNFRTWICFESSGYPRQKALEWWHKCGSGVAPNTITQALERTSSITKPFMIEVRKVGKFHEIVGYKYEDDTARTAGANQFGQQASSANAM